MRSNKKVSIIIPVYNVKPCYINDAINSALNQTHKNIEIIVVNDGSTDDETLDFLKTIDNPLIKIINQENKGLGGARNTGIENATGEYIGFLDSDDWVDTNFYEVLLNLCENNNADISCGVLTRVIKNCHIQMDIFDNIIFDSFIDKFKFINNGSVCSKLFKKDLFKNTRFIEKLYYEDNPMLVEMLTKSDRVAFTNKVKYFYRENPKSICLNPEKAQKRKNDKLYILNNICEIIKNKTVAEKEAVLDIFTKILIDFEDYSSDKKYRKEINNLLKKSNKKNFYKLMRKNLLKTIFSVKKSYKNGIKSKVITVLGIKFKFKRGTRNHA